MNEEPLKKAGDPVFESPRPLHGAKSLQESLEAEFPDIPGEDLASACETAHQQLGHVEDQDVLKARVREILRR